MGLLLMYSMKDSVTSTEICTNREEKGMSEKLRFTREARVNVSTYVYPHSVRGKNPEEPLCRCSSKARWKKPRRDDAGS